MISYVDQKLFFLNIGGGVKGVVHVKSNKVLKIVEPEVESSYLTDLAKEELKSYEHFTEEYDTKYLSGFNQKRFNNNLLKRGGNSNRFIKFQD